MTGIVGRLFREFAITMSVAVGVSALVSLTLTPMMCAKLLRFEKDEEREHTSEFYRRTEEYWTRFRNWYEGGLRWVLAHQRFILIVAVVTLVATILLYIVVPKGLLPQQDTGVIIGVTDAGENISFKAMMDRVHAVSDIVRKDPDVASGSASVGCRDAERNGKYRAALHRPQAAQPARERRKNYRAFHSSLWAD